MDMRLFAKVVQEILNRRPAKAATLGEAGLVDSGEMQFEEKNPWPSDHA